MAFNIFGDAPQSLTGLLGEQATQDLQKKALTTGLINAAIGYIAQPKNQRYGSALPYIGRALMAGQEGAQGVYQNAIKDYQLQEQIAEAKRKKAQREGFEAAVPNLMRTTPAQFETVTTPGGYAPAQTEIQEGQVAPNFGMTQLPAVSTQVQTAPARTEFDNDALLNLAIKYPDLAAPVLASMKNVRELTAAPKEDYVTLSADQIAINPVTGKTLTGKEKAKEKWSEPFNLGGQVVQQDMTTGQIRQAVTQPASTRVNVNMPAPEKAILEVDQKTLEGLTSNANSARSVASQTRTINSLIGNQQGSGVVKLNADLQNFLGIKSKEANVNQAVQAIATKAATEIRTPGSGSTSDLEFNAYRSAFPSLATSKEGRNLMAQIAEANAVRNSKLADWSRNAVRNGTFSYEGLANFDNSLGRAVSKDIENRVKSLTAKSGASNNLFNQADAIIGGK